MVATRGAEGGLIALGRAILAELLPVERREALARMRLTRTLRRAVREVPAHRGRAPSLDAFPICDARTLRQGGGWSGAWSAARSDATSGSSGGARFDVRLDASDVRRADAVWLRTYARLGLRPHHLRVRLRAPDPRTEGSRGWTGRRRLGLPMPVELSTARPIEEIADALRALRPDVVHGSATELARLAEVLIDRPLGAALVVFGGEPMHAPERERVAAAFGVWPRGVYGCTEAGFIGWECARGVVHLNADHVWVERGERVVVTTLERRLTPMIRFDTGDRVEPEGCDCSRWPALGRVLGPRHRFLRIDGKEIPEAQVAHALSGVDRARRVQVVQTRDAVTVRAPSAQLDAALRALSFLGERVGEVDEAPTWGGKRPIVDAREADRRGLTP